MVTAATMLASMNPVNAQPYSESPPSSSAITGSTVVTPSHRNATTVTDPASPTVSAR